MIRVSRCDDVHSSSRCVDAHHSSHANVPTGQVNPPAADISMLKMGKTALSSIPNLWHSTPQMERGAKPFRKPCVGESNWLETKKLANVK